jgi:8-oxo-dGDP phosphatase
VIRVSASRPTNGSSKPPQPGRSDDALRTEIFGERTLYESRWVRLTKVDIQPPSGNRFEHHVVRLQRVALAVVVRGGCVLMMWRHRFAVNRWGWEIPGGIVGEDEDAAATAAREVEEETGWRPGPLIHLASFQPMPGMVDTPHHVYLSRDAEKVGEPTDAEEAAQIEWVPLEQVPALIANGEVLGSGSLVGLLYLFARPDEVGSGGE